MSGDNDIINPTIFDLCSQIVKAGLAFVDRLIQEKRSISTYDNWPEVIWNDEGMPDFRFGFGEAPINIRMRLAHFRI